MTIKDIRKLTNLSQPHFSQKYNIPLPTLRHWEQGQRECPQYVLELLEFKVREDLENKEQERNEIMYSVIVDIAPKTISDTNGCHKYVFNSYNTKKEAISIMNQINENGTMGIATVEKSEY